MIKLPPKNKNMPPNQQDPNNTSPPTPNQPGASPYLDSPQNASSSLGNGNPTPTNPATPPTQTHGQYSPAANSELETFIAKTLSGIHSTGTWSIVLGMFNIIVTPLAELLVNSSRTGTNKLTTSSALVSGLVVGLIVGSVLIGLGLKLRKTPRNEMGKGGNTIWVLMLVLILIMILSRQIGGLINLIVLIKGTHTLQRISKLKKLSMGKT